MVEQKDVVGQLGHDQYIVLGPDSPAIPVLNKRLQQAVAMGQNPKGVTVNDFFYQVIRLSPDSYGTGFDQRLLIYVVFKHRKTGKVDLFAEYFLASWSTVFAVEDLAL
jgi:hypothetical protein